MKTKRVVHVAVAEGRGHLVRAHRLRRLFAGTEVDLEIATTHESGRDFLAELGSPSWVLPGGMRMPFDARHTMQVHELRAGMLRYLGRGLLDDARALNARRADFYVNDSFHPALLGGFVDPARVILLHGDTMEEALLDHFDGTRLARPHHALMERLLGRARRVVQHSAFFHARHEYRPTSRRARPALVLPPLLPSIAWSDATVRSAIGAPPDRPIACVYLNPHYRDPVIASAIEGALSNRFHVHAVGEGYAGRRGWRETDPHLSEVIARSALFVSGAGMASIAEALRGAVPLLVLEGSQPEQSLNIARARSTFPTGGFASIDARSLDEATLTRSIETALTSLSAMAPSPRRAPRFESERAWREAFSSIFDVSLACLDSTNPPTEVFPNAA